MRSLSKNVLASCVATCLLLPTAFAAAASDPAESLPPPEQSVVQIILFSQEPEWNAPWRFQGVNRSSGTGFVVDGQRIMTNAHVVSWARQILVLRYQDPRPFVADVEFIAHDCDLAILTVRDPSFFDSLRPLSFGELPAVRTSVVTYGYPAGGQQISYTRGVVSRIEVQPYSHIGNRQFLAVQTDAAINPGNSGGPVIQDNRVVGVAFQGIPGLENAGFFIPPPVVQHFLDDIADGAYHGFPQAGIRLSATQNPAYRSYLGLTQDPYGATVDSIVDIDSTRELLRPGDVLLRVNDYDVASDGTILYEGNRVLVSAAFQEPQHGETLNLRVWRNRQEIEIHLPVFFNETDRLIANHYDEPPKYYIHGGLVFTPLSLDYLRTLGRDWIQSAPPDVIYELYYRPHEEPATVRKEPILLATVLAHSVNANFGIRGGALIDEINGHRIESIEDVIEAFEGATGEHHVVSFMPKGTIECLDRAETEASNLQILQTYGIPSDRRL